MDLATIPSARPDYAVSRNNLGSGSSLPTDDTPGAGPDDYFRWKTNFGQNSGKSRILSPQIGLFQQAPTFIEILSCATSNGQPELQTVPFA